MPLQDFDVQVAPASPPPAPPPPGVQVGGGRQIVIRGADGAGPAAIYQAATAQRSELRGQLEHLEHTRNELRAELHNEGAPLAGAAAAGLQARIATVDQRIADLDRQLAASEARIAELAGIPGAVRVERPPPQQVPDELFVMGFLFIIFVLFPLTIALTRRLWKRGSSAVMKMPAEWNERMHRLEQAVDTVAVEVERVTEGQRFMARVLAERGLGAGPAEPVQPGAREPAHASRNRD